MKLGYGKGIMGKMQVGIETQGWKFQEKICSTFVIGEKGTFFSGYEFRV